MLIFDFDSFADTSMMGKFDHATGATRRIERGPKRDFAIAMTKEVVHDARTIAMILPYLLTFAYSLVLDVQTIYICAKAMAARTAAVRPSKALWRHLRQRDRSSGSVGRSGCSGARCVQGRRPQLQPRGGLGVPASADP